MGAGPDNTLLVPGIRWRLAASDGDPDGRAPRVRHAAHPRHPEALHLLEGGADVVSIKKLLGHVPIEATAIYLKLSTAHLRRELQRAHPRE